MSQRQQTTYVCDRCKAESPARMSLRKNLDWCQLSLQPDYHGPRIGTSPNVPTGQLVPVDICPKCAESLWDWWSTPATNTTTCAPE